MMRDGSQQLCDRYKWCTTLRVRAAAVASGYSLDSLMYILIENVMIKKPFVKLYELKNP